MPGRKVKIRDLSEGMLVDLEGDPYAEMNADESDLIAHQADYAEVWAVEVETPTCVAVEFDIAWVGFPPDHEVTVHTPDAP